MIIITSEEEISLAPRVRLEAILIIAFVIDCLISYLALRQHIQ